MTYLNICVILLRINLFSMSSCVAKSRLVHNGGYIQKLQQRFDSSEILWCGRLYLVTKVLLKLDRFYSIFATIQDFKFWKAAIMDQFVTFAKGPITLCRNRTFSTWIGLKKTAVSFSIKISLNHLQATEIAYLNTVGTSPVQSLCIILACLSSCTSGDSTKGNEKRRTINQVKSYCMSW